MKSVVKLDDVLDVTSLQAFPGAVGSILVGFFATTDALPCAAPVFQGKACGRGGTTHCPNGLFDNLESFRRGAAPLLQVEAAAPPPVRRSEAAARHPHFMLTAVHNS